jgi:aspartyl-tRNA(Asn)/glutamyl-tRNA(Gln) amidotransferase subunit B
MQKVHQIVKYLKICDGNLQEGSFRCDANVSLKPIGSPQLGTRSEIKNLNSFKFVEKAIAYEITRQEELLNDGQEIIQETRLYDSDLNETKSMRVKEEANDYRYFPDPDLLPLKIESKTIENIRSQLPELFEDKVERYVTQLKIKENDASKIANDIELASFFEKVIKIFNANNLLVANWVLTEVLGALNKDGLTIDQLGVSPESFAMLMTRINDQTISGKTAKEVFRLLIKEESDVDELIQSQGLRQMSDASELELIIKDVIQSYPDQLQQYLEGKEKVFGFFVGKVMKQTKGRANPSLVNELLSKQLRK